MPRRGGGRFGGQSYTQATIAGILNANSTNDSEARSSVGKVFGSALVLVILMDIVCAFGSVWLWCRSATTTSSDNDNGVQDDGGGGVWDGVSTEECIQREIYGGIRFRPGPVPSGDGVDEWNDGVADLFWLALFRCVTTVLLLWVGITYGRYARARGGESRLLRGGRRGRNGGVGAAAVDDGGLSVPLLATVTEEAEEDNGADNVNGKGKDDKPSSKKNKNNGSIDNSAGLEAQSNHTCIPVPNTNTTTNDNNTNENREKCLTPPKIKESTLTTLFLLSTSYQIYAGLKVATYPPHHHQQQHNEWITIDVLMCLSVLWINATTYLFRTILDEATREEGIFLDPKVHRHPVFWVDNRGVALHWCDLCQRRIGNDPNNTNASITSSANNNNRNNNNNEPSNTGVYRCSLCDFDVCATCAARTDAATVGENLLRTDGEGVRPEPNLDNRSYMARTVRMARGEAGLLAVSFVLLAGNSLGRVIMPHLQGKIIDSVIVGGDDGGGGGEDQKAQFRYYIMLYVVLMLVQGAVSTGYSAIFTLVSRRLKFTIRNSLFEKILAQDIAYFDGTESGRLISRLTNDLQMMMSPIQSSLSSLLNNLLLLLGGMIMCFTKSYRLSMLAFVTIGPITYLWDMYAQWSKGLARQMLSYWAEGNSVANQALSHVRTVKAFGCEDKVLRRYTEANEQALHCGVKDAWGNGFTSALTGYLDLGSGVLILYFGGHLVYDGEMTVGELVTFQLFWNMMNNAYQGLQGLVTDFTRSAAGAEKVFALWDSKPDIDPHVGDGVDWDVRGRLEMKNVKFFYQMRPDNVVLDGFDLVIPAGKTVALVGRSGGGKSTIINMLLRFYDAKEGSVSIDGRPYTSIRVNELRRLFGVVTQETELFAATVEENIAFGMDQDEYTQEDLVTAAKKAYAHDFIVEMKDGYKTRIGERGNRLSGGQRQRIAIARVFLRKPRIILLDEATSALDEDSQEQVQKALGTLIEESRATVVLVAHRLTTVMGADSIVVIDKGVVLEQGSHEELVGMVGGLYASLVQKQHKKETDQLDQQKRGAVQVDNKTALDDIDSLLS